MSKRLHPSWVVTDSIENPGHDRCVDLFRRPDGTYGFEEFRRDPEDQGAWTPVAWFSGLGFATEAAARAEAMRRVVWFGAQQGK